MNRLSLLLAWRYLWGAKTKRSVNTVMIIAFIGIAVGACALTLTVAIMQGFEHVTHEQLQSIHAQVIIRAYGNPINMQTLTPVLQEEFPEIAAFAPSALQQVFIKNNTNDEMSALVGIKGIEPAKEAKVTKLEQKLSMLPDGTAPTLTQLLTNNSIIIGEKLAHSLGLKPGDTITLFYAPHEPKRKKITLAQAQATIAGFFSTGIEEFDMGLIICPMQLFNTLFPDNGITQVHVHLQKEASPEKLIERLRKRLGIEVYSWQELYPALVSALKLEKYVMSIILALITLIASMNIISLLLMHITQKKADIAILQAMGMRSRQVKQIFFVMGMSIAIMATIAGIIIAIGLCYLLQTYHIIELPDIYFVQHIPIHLTWNSLVYIFSLIILISFVAVSSGLSQAESIDITHVLRFNG